MSDSSDRWYKDNKMRVSAERKEKYANDPEYREQVKRRSQKWRDDQPIDPVLEDYPHSLEDVLRKLGMKYWQLKEWQKKAYFPEPFKLNGRPYFTDNQLELLNSIRNSLPEDVESKVQLVFANW